MIPKGDIGELLIMPQCTNRFDVYTAHLPDLHVSAQGNYYTILVGDPKEILSKTIKIYKDGTAEVM